MGGGRFGAVTAAVLTLGLLSGCHGSGNGTYPPVTTQPSMLQPQIDRLAHVAPLPPSRDAIAAPAPPLTSPVRVGHADAVTASVANPPSVRVATLPTAAPAPPPTPMTATAALPQQRVPPSPVDVAVADLLKAVGHAPRLRSLLDPIATIKSAITYRVCAESADHPLACTIDLPVGVPALVYAEDGLLPDVLATLTPFIPIQLAVDLLPFSLNLALGGIGVAFDVQRLTLGPLPAHVFAVYDVPGTNQRLEYGYDGRSSTLALNTNTVVTLAHLPTATNPDLEVSAAITHLLPGATEAETLALAGPDGQGSAAILRMTPVPALISADVNVRPNHTTVSVDTTQPTTALVSLTQHLGVGATDLSALVDRLPAHVGIDLQTAPQTVVSYGATAPIGHLHVAQRMTPDTADPSSFNQLDGDVSAVPASLNVAVGGLNDITYGASSVIPSAQVVTQMQKHGVVQSALAATFHGVPKHIHISYTKRLVYDADSALTDLEVGSYQGTTVLHAVARSLPTHAVLTLGNGAYDYASSNPIGVVEATLSIGGGATIPMPGVDHLTFRQRGTAIGLDARISGVKDAHVLIAGSTYSLALTPGGQRFEAVADLDSPARLATLDISNMPPTATITLDLAAATATYDAGAVIRSVAATYSQPGAIGTVSLTDVPTHVAVHWPTTDKTFTYHADRRLGSISVVAQLGQATFDGEVDDLPLSVEASLGSPMTVTTADHVGRIMLRYASSGSLPTTADPNDHLYLDVGAATRAELLYDGLESASFDGRNGEIHVALANTAAHRFDVAIIAPGVTASGFIDAVPAQVHVDFAGQGLGYHASSPIGEVALDVARDGGDSVEADVRDIPTDLSLNFASSAVHWVASGPTGGGDALAHLTAATTGIGRAVDALVNVTGVPSRWDADFSGGDVALSTSAPLSSLALRLTDHGTVAAFDHDGLSANYDSRTGDFDGFVQVSDLRSGTVTRLDPGFRVALQMGTGGSFGLHASVRTSGNVVTADGLISDLPTKMDLTSQDGGITYTGDRNPTANLSFAYGDPSTVGRVADPPRPHGVAVRDTAGAIKANLYITGLPTSLTIDPAHGRYAVGDFHPTVDPLTLDLDLAHTLAARLKVLATQVVGTTAPVSFTIGPITTAGNSVSADYQASRPMGPFTADVTLGRDVGHLVVDTIPRSLHLSANFGQDVKTVKVALGDKIGSIAALYRRTSDKTWIAGAQLTDVPRDVNVVITPTAHGDHATLFSYTADAPGLGLTAFVDASAFTNNFKAFVQLVATDLGSHLTMTRNGSAWVLASTPEPTGAFTLVATADFPKLVLPAPPKLPGVKLTLSGSLTLDVNQLTIGFTGLHSLSLDLGYTTAVRGVYGTFTFGEQSATTITMQAHASALGRTLADVDLKGVPLGNVIGNFRVASDSLGPWLQAGPRACIRLDPQPLFTTAGPTFTLPGPGTTFVTIDPEALIPDEVSDLLAVIILHRTNEISLHC